MASGLSVAAQEPARQSPPPASTVPAHGVIGVQAAQLTPEFWINRLQHPDRVLLARDDIATQNTRLLGLGDSMRDLAALSNTLSRQQAIDWIQQRSAIPTSPRFDEQGQRVNAKALETLRSDLALDQVPASQQIRYGLVTHRADLRTFPTAMRVFSTPGDTDIDRFQETALFPGEAVVVVHASSDGSWHFVLSERYTGWMQSRFVAEGSKSQVMGYGTRGPFRVVTGATVRTTFTPGQPQVSALQLDMGVRMPNATGWPPGKRVNGQHPYTGHVIELPIRGDDGRLQLVPALLPRRADSADDYLPLTRSNLIAQSFKFLGERYGWGHDYGARDCSGFTSEVYRSMGVVLPRNTGDQASSPAFTRQAFDDSTPFARRKAALARLEVGDLVYIPGHVMLVIGHLHGTPYVIHDIQGGDYIGPDGTLVELHLNGVSVTPLLPMALDEHTRYVDRITAIVSPQVRLDAGP